MQEETKNYYDGIAKGYKELYHNEQIKKIQNILSYLQNLIENSKNKINILDLGSGDGVLNQFLTDKKINLTSFDLSQELLALNTNTNTVSGSVTNMPFENNSFDLILSFTMIQDVDDIEKAFEEIVRVLKEKSVLIISFLKMSSKKELIMQQIYKNFKIIKKIEEEKDLILILNLHL